MIARNEVVVSVHKQGSVSVCAVLLAHTWVCFCPQLASATRLFSKMLGSLGRPWGTAEEGKAALLTGEKQGISKVIG